ncbi:MAG: RNA polymerase sigma factor [Ruminococcus sp.]|nr:RNA polymerase sigma factor [Ruminococcus sp.]
MDKGDTALYAFRKYGDTVIRAAYAVCGSYHEAEDITQEVFLKLHSSGQSFSGDDHLKAWLLRAAINRAKNYKKSFRVSRTDFADEEAENVFAAEDSHEAKAIQEGIKRLPERYSSVIFLYYYEGYNAREIGEILGISENTASSRLTRGRKKLKAELEKEGYHE